MRSSVGGCVLNSLAISLPVNGATMNGLLCASGTRSGMRRPAVSSFCNALANPRPDPENSAPKRSASNSRERLMAIWIKDAAKGAKISNNNATKKCVRLLPPPQKTR